MNPELIECLKSFIRSKHLTNEWNIFRDNWFNEINSEASNESLSVRKHEQLQEFCNCNEKPKDFITFGTGVICGRCKLPIQNE